MICVEHFRNVFQVKKNLSQDNYIRNSQFQKSVRRHVSKRHEISSIVWGTRLIYNNMEHFWNKF